MQTPGKALGSPGNVECNTAQLTKLPAIAPPLKDWRQVMQNLIRTKICAAAQELKDWQQGSLSARLLSGARSPANREVHSALLDRRPK